MLTKLQKEILEDNYEHFINVYKDYFEKNSDNLSDEDLYNDIKDIILKRDQDSYELVTYSLGIELGSIDEVYAVIQYQAGSEESNNRVVYIYRNKEDAQKECDLLNQKYGDGKYHYYEVETMILK